MTPNQRLAKALKAIRIAQGILDYVPGDKWEREVTKRDRETFDKLCAELATELFAEARNNS